MQGSAGTIIVSKNDCMIIYTIIFTSFIPPNTEFHQTPSSTKHRVPPNTEFHQTPSSTKHRIPPNTEFHQTPSSTKHRVPPNTEFHQTPSSTKHRVPPNTEFHQTPFASCSCSVLFFQNHQLSFIWHRSSHWYLVISFITLRHYMQLIWWNACSLWIQCAWNK